LFDVFHDRFGDATQRDRGPIMPSIDVSETDREMRIRADLPGMSASDIDVSLVDDILSIRGERKVDKADETESYHVVERSRGTFLRSLRLPYSVDAESIRADFNNGVLTVTLRKCKDKERSRKVPVEDGQHAGGT
jgi:HSP20 family protein